MQQQKCMERLWRAREEVTVESVRVPVDFAVVQARPACFDASTLRLSGTIESGTIKPQHLKENTRNRPSTSLIHPRYGEGVLSLVATRPYCLHFAVSNLPDCLNRVVCVGVNLVRSGDSTPCGFVSQQVVYRDDGAISEEPVQLKIVHSVGSRQLDVYLENFVVLPLNQPKGVGLRFQLRFHLWFEKQAGGSVALFACTAPFVLTTNHASVWGQYMRLSHGGVVEQQPAEIVTLPAASASAADAPPPARKRDSVEQPVLSPLSSALERPSVLSEPRPARTFALRPPLFDFDITCPPRFRHRMDELLPPLLPRFLAQRVGL